MSDQQDSFEEIQTRLQEIVDAVSDDALPLDDALTLYEEAVQLGLRASTLLEEGIAAQDSESNSDSDEEESSLSQGVLMTQYWV